MEKVMFYGAIYILGFVGSFFATAYLERKELLDKRLFHAARFSGYIAACWILWPLLAGGLLAALGMKGLPSLWRQVATPKEQRDTEISVILR